MVGWAVVMARSFVHRDGSPGCGRPVAGDPLGSWSPRSVPLRPEGVATCHPLDERTRSSGVPGGTPLAWWSDDRFGWLRILG